MCSFIYKTNYGLLMSNITIMQHFLHVFNLEIFKIGFRDKVYNVKNFIRKLYG